MIATYTVRRGNDKAYPWELIDPDDGTPIARFANKHEAKLAAQLFTDHRSGRS